MKYEIGNLVVLINGKTGYITGYDEKTKKYKGFDAEDDNPQKEILFSESSVLMKI